MVRERKRERDIPPLLLPEEEGRKEKGEGGSFVGTEDRYYTGPLLTRTLIVFGL